MAATTGTFWDRIGIGKIGAVSLQTTVMYGWTNLDGSNMNAMFQGRSLMQKAQFEFR